MTRLPVTSRRQVAGCILLLCSLVSVMNGCGRTSANDGDEDDSPTPGGGGSASGGTRGGHSGNMASSGSQAAGDGGVETSGGARAGSSTTAGGKAVGGAAGAVGMAGAGGAASDSCVNISGGGVEPWYDLTIVGAQFDAEEGEHMRIAVATQEGNRVGIADIPIAGGAFTVSMPAVLNAGAYVGVVLYVDRNGNDVCETDEHVWDWATRSVMGDVRYDVTPDELCSNTMMTCRPWKPTQAACLVGSGDTNLMEPLPCKP